jgi:GDP/UDP-N,N'-diacetylbacillosamine 2-epimerase (hydrolysing)
MKNKNVKSDNKVCSKRKILVITGSRAEYGILKYLILKLKKSKTLSTTLLATGTHLLKKFGLTVNEIEGDGIKVDYPLMLSKMNAASSNGVAESISEGISKFAKIYDLMEPDLLLILGDRFEIFAAATAALVKKIPVAHIHGGEITQGAYDDTFRHCITKMAHLHFVSHDEYKKRVVQLGENPDRVHVVGALGVENISKLKLLNKRELESKLNIKFLKKSLMITYHPETLARMSVSMQIDCILEALKDLTDTTLIFTLPNADTHRDEIVRAIKKFQARNKNTYIYSSLGQVKYFSCLQFVDGVIGNSSSGIIEAPSFKIGTVNIGERQLGRMQAESIINSKLDSKEISSSIKKLYSTRFRGALSSVENPYLKKNTAENILKKLASTNLENLIVKKFYDL